VELTTGVDEAREPGGNQLPSLYVEPEKPAGEIEWPALEFNDVFKIYESGSARTVALRGLDLRVERSELVAVIGPSGSGKSTLLALAAALDQPSAGDVTADGRSLAHLDEAGLASHRASGVAIVFQSDNLWPELSAQENVATALRLAGRPHPERTAAETLGEFGLSERTHLRPRSLSGGEQQRVAIAAAAARRAPLVLADEPTGELDEKNEGIVLRSLADLRDRFKSTIVVVTHSDRVAAACDRVVALQDGKVANGKAAL
jgi:putative ABC transport system ATP-binding protein